MKRNSFLPLSLVLALLLALFPAAQAADSVTPTPPDWVPAEEYAVFEGSAAYTPENWETILQARSEVAWGAINLGALTQRRAFDALPTYNKETKGYDLGMLLEKALIETRLLYTHDSYVNGPFWTSLSIYLKSPDSELLDGLTDQQRYALLLWVARDTLRYRGTEERTFQWLPALMKFPQFSLEKLWTSPIFSAEEQAEYARTVPEGWTAYCNRVELYLDGQELEMDVAPEVKNERTMVPIRVVAEAIGADVEWVADTRQIIMTRAGSTVIMTLDQTAATVDGQSVQMDVAPYAAEGRTLIPARYVAEFFGQKVDWDGEKRRVDITEDKSAAAGSNLEEWALTMGVIRWEIERRIDSSDPFPVPFFGQYDRNAKSVQEVRESLVSAWSILDRDDLIDTVTRMTLHGHNDSFQADAAYIKGLSPAEFSAYCNSDGMDSYMFPYTMTLAEKWGDKGILAWDLSRMSNLVQWGYTAGYLTYTEALELIEPAARLAQETFSSWKEFYLNYLDGYNWWARNDVSSLRAEYEARLTEKGLSLPEDFEDWMVLPRAIYYMRLVNNKMATLDDTLFQTGVIGLPE